MKKPKEIKPVQHAVLDPELAKKHDKYIEMLENGALHKECLLATGLEWKQVSNCRKNYPEYRDRYRAAEEVRDEKMKAERFEAAHQRATIGVKKSVTTPMGIVGHDFVPSDRLLEILLKRDRPDEFAERQSIKADLATTFGTLLGEIERETTNADVPLLPAESSDER